MDNSETRPLDTKLTIRTSEHGWLQELAKAYRVRREVLIVDDANAGVDPSTQSLLSMGLRCKLSRNEWIALVVSAGMSAGGAAMVVLAIIDPDPTSKLGLLIGSGAAFLLTGGVYAMRIRTRVKPPSVRMSPMGIEVRWE